MKTFVTAVTLVAVACFFLGCHKGPYQATTYKPGTTSLEHTEKVIFASNIGGKVRLVAVKDTVLPDGRLEVYAELENMTGKNLVVQVQAQFKDASGALLRDETNWKTIVMAPRSSESYRENSMNANAKDFIIRVKLEKT
jgi:uncharacterized protein YcfL